jgi:hypothetical protein
MPEEAKQGVPTHVESNVVGGHMIEGTRIWCDRAPYDVTEDRAEVERLIRHALDEPGAPSTIGFTMAKNLLPCALIVAKISAIEPHVVK